MGLFSHKISRDELKAGDHIYSWRNAYIYSHHGIYVGDGKVIHFTRGGGLETGTGTVLDKFIVSSVPNHGGRHNPCPNCGDQSTLDGVISSCLDCFLAGGNLYLFEYGVSTAMFLAKPRGGTCTIASSDPCDDVIYRAEFLLLRNGFGAYHLFENNCEDFAIYCKTGLVVLSKIKLGSSGQATTASVASDVLPWTFSLFGAVKCGGKAASVVTSTLGYVCTGVGSLVSVGFGKYCLDRLLSDVGMRSDVTKVSVERLVAIVEVMEGRSNNSNNNKGSTGLNATGAGAGAGEKVCGSGWLRFQTLLSDLNVWFNGWKLVLLRKFCDRLTNVCERWENQSSSKST